MYATTRYNFVRLKATHKISPLEELVGGDLPPSSSQRLSGMKWRIAINIQCNFCGQDEDYLQCFMSFPYLKEFWVKIQQILKKSNIENFVTLKHIVFGYKIFYFNYILTILGFSIYKAYYVSGKNQGS